MQEWNRAIEAIEADLTAEIDVGTLARIALTSEYHFRRMFSSLAGLPVSEYIRRRRLTAATAEIIDGGTVLAVAVRYGYASAEAFTRAFKAMHGLTPSEARQAGAVLHSQPQLRFHLRVEGNTDMKHRIEDKPAFRLIGLKARVPLVHEGPNQAIIDFQRSLDPADTQRLLKLADLEPAGPLSVTDNIDEQRSEGSGLDYWHAVASSRSRHRRDSRPWTFQQAYGWFSKLKESSRKSCKACGRTQPPSGSRPTHTSGHPALKCSASKWRPVARTAAGSCGFRWNGKNPARGKDRGTASPASGLS